MSNKKLFIFFFLFLVAITAISFNHIQAEEVEYNLLAPIPLSGGADPTDATIPSNYIKGIFILIIASASVLAVLRIIFAGIKYMSTDAFQNKSEAKGDIQNAIWGLALAMGAYLILNTINPSLTNLNLEIPGLKTGSELGGELGKIPSTPEEITEEKEAIQCEESCAPVSIEESQIGTIAPKGPGPRGSGSAGCDSSLVTVCYLDTELLRDLQSLTKEEGMEGIEWQVTELYPPTRDHQHACQNIGTPVRAMCVDASLKNLECANIPNSEKERCGATKGTLGATVTETERLRKDAQKIETFIEEAQKQGLYVVYEVTTDDRRDQIRSRLPQTLRSLIVAPKYTSGEKAGYSAITGEHFSIYRDYSVYNFRR